MSVVKSTGFLPTRKLVEVGDLAPDFVLVDCEGEKHKLSDFRGTRVILSFFRYASCPICLYNVDRLKQQMDFLYQAGILTISIFPSTPENIAKYSKKKMSKESLVLSDKEGVVYKSFQVNRQTAKSMINGAVEIFAKNRKKYMKHWDSSGLRRETLGPGSSRLVKHLPADFLIDERGRVIDLFRAKNPQDHMPIDRIEAFVPEVKRCKCNDKGCFFPSCRQRYEEIRKEAEAMLFMG